MGASHSARASWPPPGARRKHILALLKINGHATGPTVDVEVSQASEVICEILEHVFSFLTTSEHDDVNRLQLVTVSRVNRHWNQVARRLLYRSITLTTSKQLTLLLRTIDSSRSTAAQIQDLSVPALLRSDPSRTHNAAGIRLSPDQVERERTQAQRASSTALLTLLSKLTALTTLTLHAKSIKLHIHSPDGALKPPALPNLSTIRNLTLLGLHDARWLFLLKYTLSVEHFHATPAWHASDDPVLPFDRWNLKSLALVDGVRLNPAQFEKLITPPASSGCTSSQPTRSALTSLTLINVPTLFTSPRLPSFLAALSSSLTSLTLSTSSKDELANITCALTETLPRMTALSTLSTNAFRLRTLSPNLSSLRLSLAHNPAEFHPCTSLATTTSSSSSNRRNSSSPPSSPNATSGSPTHHPIGTIYDTISGILDVLSSSSPSPTSTTSSNSTTKPRPPLTRLTLLDAPLEDYLHFHLVGSDDWGDTNEAGKQTRLWMRAAQLNVLIVVEKFKDDAGNGNGGAGGSTRSSLVGSSP